MKIDYVLPLLITYIVLDCWGPRGRVTPSPSRAHLKPPTHVPLKPGTGRGASEARRRVVTAASSRSSSQSASQPPPLHLSCLFHHAPPPSPLYPSLSLPLFSTRRARTAGPQKRPDSWCFLNLLYFVLKLLPPPLHISQ